MPQRTARNVAKDGVMQKRHDLLDQAAQWMYASLQTSPLAMTYLKKRGFDDATMGHFRIGWSSNGGFIPFMRQQGWSDDALVDSGLVVRSQKDGSLFQRFRQRIMFPIVNSRGRVVAFGGRIVPTANYGTASVAKYINSPETALFVKSKTVYQSPEWRRQDTTVIVEGYFDVMAVHAIANAVAPLGTAMTADQLQHVWKRCPCPVVCFDGDSAGQKAQFKLAVLALSLLRPGYSLSFVTLPSGEDPCAVMMVKGAAVMKELIHHAMSLSDYVWSCLFKGRMTPEQRALAVQQWNTMVQTIPDPTVRRFYKQYLYQKDKPAHGKGALFAPDPQLGVKILLTCFVCFPELREKLSHHIKNVTLPNGFLWKNVYAFIMHSDHDKEWLTEYKKQLAPYIRYVPKTVQGAESYWMQLYTLCTKQL